MADLGERGIQVRSPLWVLFSVCAYSLANFAYYVINPHLSKQYNSVHDGRLLMVRKRCLIPWIWAQLPLITVIIYIVRTQVRSLKRDSRRRWISPLTYFTRYPATSLYSIERYILLYRMQNQNKKKWSFSSIFLHVSFRMNVIELRLSGIRGIFETHRCGHLITITTSTANFSLKNNANNCQINIVLDSLASPTCAGYSSVMNLNNSEEVNRYSRPPRIKLHVCIESNVCRCAAKGFLNYLSGSTSCYEYERKKFWGTERV